MAFYNPVSLLAATESVKNTCRLFSSVNADVLSYCNFVNDRTGNFFALLVTYAIERTDSRVTFNMRISKNSRCFRHRRAIGFDRASGAIEFNCPSGSKTSRIFQHSHVESGTTVRHFDGFNYK